MSLLWREARREDVPEIVAMLADDALGQARESSNLGPYVAAFEAMQAEGGNRLIVGERAGEVVATYQLTIISGLSLKATRRAQIESVRVASHARGKGIGAEMFADAERRARDAGCGLMQLTTNSARARAHAFYEGLGYVASHVGFKKSLD